MQPVARLGKIRIEHVKIHAPVDRISGKPQIHLEHTGVMSFLMQIDGTKMTGNTPQSLDKVGFARVHGADIPWRCAPRAHFGNPS
jgi:hypothetical protein